MPDTEVLLGVAHVRSMCGKKRTSFPLHVNVNRCAGVAALSGQRNQAGRQGRTSGAQTEKHPRRWKRRHGTERDG